MGILVVLAIAQLLHEFGGRIAQMQRHGGVTRLVDQCQCLVDGQIGTVALGRRSQIDGTLAERNASLGPADLADDIKCGVGQEQSVGVGQTDVLGRTDAQPPGNELGVLAAGDEPGQPVDCRIGVATAYALDKRRDDVVVHLAALVEVDGILLQTVSYNLVVDDKWLKRSQRLHDEVEDVEQLACVAAGKSQQCVGLLDAHLAVLKHLVGLDGPVEQLQQVVAVQWLQHIDLRPREQRPDDLERGVLGGGPDEGDRAILHGPKQ